MAPTVAWANTDLSTPGQCRRRASRALVPCSGVSSAVAYDGLGCDSRYLRPIRDRSRLDRPPSTAAVGSSNGAGHAFDRAYSDRAPGARGLI